MKETPAEFFDLRPNSIRKRKSSSFGGNVPDAIFKLTADLDDLGTDEVQKRVEARQTGIFSRNILRRNNEQTFFARKTEDGVVVGFKTSSRNEGERNETETTYHLRWSKPDKITRQITSGGEILETSEYSEKKAVSKHLSILEEIRDKIIKKD